jgi:hypothetical protein
MPFIKLDDGTMLNINEVERYEEKRHKITEPIFPSTPSGISKKAGNNVRQETELRITTTNGKKYILHGPLADDALKILKAG